MVRSGYVKGLAEGISAQGEVSTKPRGRQIGVYTLVLMLA